jgi:hypothetical protein
MDLEEQQAALGFQIGGDALDRPPGRIVRGPRIKRRVETNLCRSPGGQQ